FPGHGDTASDSHLDLPLLPHDRDRLNQIELPPFRDVIAAGVDSVMTAHLLLPQLDPDRPATLSSVVLSDLLRKDLGFDGLVVTDALVMEAITARHGAAEAAVLAFEAGADLILMPADAQAAIRGLCQAIAQGRIPMHRLHTALHRRRQALARFDAHASLQEQPLPTLAERELEQQLVAASLELRPAQGVPSSSGINLIRVDGVWPCPALSGPAPALRRPESIGYRSVVVHSQGVSPWQDDPEAPLALDRLGDGPVLLQLFLRGNPFRGDRDRQEPWRAAVQQLQNNKRLIGLIVYGSPYLWDELRDVLEPSIAAAYSPGQMPQAQKQVLTALLRDSSTIHSPSDFTD
ncbi:MAG: glycosyl hydrolase family 3, partial [Synechococcus sp. BS307-5m-G38]|nr:glycosyl hydrolase family 3 [Synechococcus sp. BS307-5m-G38]